MDLLVCLVDLEQFILLSADELLHLFLPQCSILVRLFLRRTRHFGLYAGQLFNESLVLVLNSVGFSLSIQSLPSFRMRLLLDNPPVLEFNTEFEFS